MQCKQKYRLLFHKALPRRRKRTLKETGPNEGFAILLCGRRNYVCLTVQGKQPVMRKSLKMQERTYRRDLIN